MGGKAALPRRRVARALPAALPAALLGVLLAGLVALAGCAAPPGPSGPPPTPSAPVDTPDGYQSMLNQTDDQLDSAFAVIGQARSLEALEQAVLEGAGAASAASERLTTSGPVPVSVSGDNAALAAGLRQFGRADRDQHRPGHARPAHGRHPAGYPAQRPAGLPVGPSAAPAARRRAQPAAQRGGTD